MFQKKDFFVFFLFFIFNRIKFSLTESFRIWHSLLFIIYYYLLFLLFIISGIVKNIFLLIINYCYIYYFDSSRIY